ncbi:12664_t:CDS:2 [Funneliformis caledonium]|uniref:12664_t:CDS:1 n=1 Tax=Funneliformis caledonium TaxID=1117310 RepID=A0A9N8UYR3_9GLOM|nr:12664_t:CDS:2 [Funneliformis caledonium]
MLKIYSILPFNKFAGFILYGLLSVALITLAQEDNIANTKNCIVETFKQYAEENKQKTIGYVQLFSQSKIPKIQWDNYDYINVIAYPNEANGGKYYTIFRPGGSPDDVSVKLNLIKDLVMDKERAKANTKANTQILLSLRNYDIGKWPQGQQADEDYQRIIDDANKTITDYKLDGIDIEYPGKRGNICKNPKNLDPNHFTWDKNNDDRFITFLKDLREELNGKTLMLTVGRDVIGNLKEIDYLNIETYHNSIYQNLKAPDNNNFNSYPNSPLDAYQIAYSAWFGVGINSNQIIMGVDFGNTIQMVPNEAIKQTQFVTFPKSASLYGFNQLNDQIQPIRDFCSENNSNLYSWPWRNLSNTVLNSSLGFCATSNPNWIRKFDQKDNSGTPWLYSDAELNFQFLYVSYEDVSSLRSKLEFAKAKSLGGISISDVSYDDNDNTLSNFMQPIRGKSAVGSSSPSNGSGNGNSKSNPNNNVGMKKGIITGSIVGSVLGLFILVSCAYWYRQKTLRKSEVDISPELSSNRIVSSTTVIPSDRRIIDHLIIE